MGPFLESPMDAEADIPSGFEKRTSNGPVLVGFEKWILLLNLHFAFPL
jgi:hypothetical protein